MEAILLLMSSLVDSGSSLWQARTDSTLDTITSFAVFRRNRMSVGEYLRSVFVQGTGRNIPDPVFVGFVAFLNCVRYVEVGSV